MHEIKVGMIGFGTVGSGVVKILQENSQADREAVGSKDRS